jgi:hypothetical protein
MKLPLVLSICCCLILFSINIKSNRARRTKWETITYPISAYKIVNSNEVSPGLSGLVIRGGNVIMNLNNKRELIYLVVPGIIKPRQFPKSILIPLTFDDDNNGLIYMALISNQIQYVFQLPSTENKAEIIKKIESVKVNFDLPDFEQSVSLERDQFEEKIQELKKQMADNTEKIISLKKSQKELFIDLLDIHSKAKGNIAEELKNGIEAKKRELNSLISQIKEVEKLKENESNEINKITEQIAWNTKIVEYARKRMENPPK